MLLWLNDCKIDFFDNKKEKKIISCRLSSISMIFFFFKLLSRLSYSQESIYYYKFIILSFYLYDLGSEQRSNAHRCRPVPKPVLYDVLGTPKHYYRVVDGPPSELHYFYITAYDIILLLCVYSENASAQRR